MLGLCLQSSSDIGDDVTPTNIISKLSLLVLHFPRLRIIWSRSLHATAEIFFSLKANQDEPDEIKAMRIGVTSEDGVVENDVRYERIVQPWYVSSAFYTEILIYEKACEMPVSLC